MYILFSIYHCLYIYSMFSCSQHRVGACCFIQSESFYLLIYVFGVCFIQLLIWLAWSVPFCYPVSQVSHLGLQLNTIDYLILSHRSWKVYSNFVWNFFLRAHQFDNFYWSVFKVFNMGHIFLFLHMSRIFKTCWVLWIIHFRRSGICCLPLRGIEFCSYRQFNYWCVLPSVRFGFSLYKGGSVWGSIQIPVMPAA